MSVIKQLAVYDGSNWTTDNIGADASNVSLTTNVAGQNNVQSALSSLFGTSALVNNKVLVSGSSGNIITSNITNTELSYLSGATSNIQSQIDTLNDEFISVEEIIGDTDISTIGDGSVTGAIDELNSKVTENTGWVALGNHIQYKKYRGIVWVKIFNGNNVELNKNGVSLGTLPVGFRPNTQLNFGATSLGGSEVVFFRADSNGNVTGYADIATKYWGGTMVYPAA